MLRICKLISTHQSDLVDLRKKYLYILPEFIIIDCIVKVMPILRRKIMKYKIIQLFIRSKAENIIFIFLRIGFVIALKLDT